VTGVDHLSDYITNSASSGAAVLVAVQLLGRHWERFTRTLGVPFRKYFQIFGQHEGGASTLPGNAAVSTLSVIGPRAPDAEPTGM
jgi:hypothetical protein